MTNRVGNKDEAHQRSKEEKARIKASNLAQEAVKKAAAAAKYHNEIKNHPRPATSVDEVKSDETKKKKNDVKKTAAPAKPKSVKPAKPATKAARKTTAAKTVKAKAATDKPSKASKKAASDKDATGGKKQESKE